MDTVVQEIYDNVLNGQTEAVKSKVQAALEARIAPPIILNDGMISAMAEVGRLFENGEYFVPEMLISARAMQAGLTILKPYLVESEIQSKGKVVIGTVKGDLHDIGKNLVAMMLEGAGFEIVDLGTDVSPETYVEVARKESAQIVAMSALLTTTMPAMERTIEALNTAGLRSMVKVMVGGAPITQDYANQIGADGYAPDASRAVSTAKNLLLLE